MDASVVSAHHVETPIVLTLVGDLDLLSQPRFESVVFDLLDRRSVVVDLARLDFMAISALRSLVLCHRYAAVRGRGVVYASPSREVRRLLALSRLDRRLALRRSATRRQLGWGTGGSARATLRLDGEGSAGSVMIPRQGGARA